MTLRRERSRYLSFRENLFGRFKKSAGLIDSVIKGYPIGTFIFWSTKERLRSVRNLGSVSLPDAKEGQSVLYVLDGQQRLTSLFATLKGLEVQRASGKSDDFSNIFVDLTATPDEQIVITDLTEKDPRLCIRLCDLLYGGLSTLAAYPEPFHEKLDRYKQRIQSYDFSLTEVRDVTIDVATEIFTRLNVGGVPLTLFEIMIAKTYDDKLAFDLSEKFDRLIEDLQRIDYETVSHTPMLQLISLIVKGDCEKQHILQINKATFIETWPKAVDAIERAAEYFANVYRITVSELLPYNTLLVTFGYFFYKHPDKPDADQRILLEDLFWRCSLAGRYSSSVESKLVQDVGKVERILARETPEYDWGIDLSSNFLITNGWFNAGRSFVKAILCLFAFHEPKSFNDGGRVNIRNNWLKQANSKNYHHFFPRAYLDKRGIEETRINNVFNITIVDDYLNKRRIRARAPSDYMREFAHSNRAIAQTMRSHLIDDLDGFGVWTDDYDKFLRMRTEAVSKELQSRIIPRNIDAVGQSTRLDDLPEEMTTIE